MAEYSEVDLIHEDFRKNKDSEQKLINKIPQNVKLLMVVAIIIAIWYFGLTHGNWKTVGLIVIGVFVAAMIWAGSDTPGQTELTDLQLRTLLWKQLRYYQLNAFGNHFVIPDGEIRLMASVARWTVDESVKYRTYGVEIVKRNGVKIYYSVDVNIYTGDIMKMEEGYFSGREKPHIKYIQSEEVARQKRYDEAIGKISK